ncbi:MAG: hypothetical protein MUC34_07385 [Anaerolineae bacterium]|jgi:hypothetical protein|nr:hypothetical protein [Anaerolineae bacterium]
MLHRPTSAPIWSPLRWLGDRRAALAGPLSGLLRYVIIAALLTAIGCVYLWQVNSLSNTYDATLKLEAQARDLEQQNWLLAEQLARWSSPAYVDRLSVEQGYVQAPVTTLASPVLVAAQPSSGQ